MHVSGERWRLGRRSGRIGAYALVSLYFGVVFKAFGLRGGDLEGCAEGGITHTVRTAGGCPYFAGPLHHNPWDAAVLRYQIWSSRFTVEVAEYALSHTLWLFVIITLALSWLFIWSAADLLRIRSGPGLLAFAGLFCLLVPPKFHSSAGVYSTVIFYSWTTFLGTFAVAMMVRAIRREGPSRLLLAATVPALLFALCSEQFVVAVTFAVAALAHRTLVGRRTDLRGLLALYLALWAAAVVNILVCPGNAVRKSQEIPYWMPWFTSISPAGKIIQGMHHSLYLLVTPSISTFVLFVTLAVALMRSARATRRSARCGVAVLVWLGVVSVLTAAGVGVRDRASMTLVAVAVVAIPVVAGGAELTKADRSTRRLIVMLLAAGFAAAMLMSFSPTVWASNTRTLFIEYLAFVGGLFLLVRSATRPVDSTPRPFHPMGARPSAHRVDPSRSSRAWR